MKTKNLYLLEILFLAVYLLMLNNIVSSQSDNGLPYFAPSDMVGGVPENLIEIRPGSVHECDIIPAGSYFVWVAIKEMNVSWLNWDWKKFGPYNFIGGQRYNAHIGQWGLIVDKYENLQYGKILKSESCLRFENLYSDKWIGTTIPEPASGSMNSNDNSASGKIDGKYNLNVNNYKGILEISGNGTTGKMFLEIGNKWEELSNMAYNSSTGEIYFTRPWAGNPYFQQYNGKVSGSRISGTFTDNNSPGLKFNWEAEK